METRTIMHRLRRPAVGAIIFATAVSSAIGWSAVAAASDAPHASLVGDARAFADQMELGTAANGANTPNAPKDTCSTETSPEATDPGIDIGPIGPYEPLPMADYGDSTPKSDVGQVDPCSTDTTPGSTDAGPGANAGPDAGNDVGPVNDGPVTDPAKPDLLDPNVDYGDPTPVDEGGQPTDCTTVSSDGSTDSQGTGCSSDTTPGSTDGNPGDGAGPVDGGSGDAGPIGDGTDPIGL